MRPRRRDATSDQEIVELAALADGSLAPERRAELEARVAASSELAALLAEQERAVSFARSAAAEVEAPETLRAHIPTGERPRRGPVRHRLVLISAATATAVLAVGIGLAVFNSGTSATRFEAAACELKVSPHELAQESRAAQDSQARQQMPPSGGTSATAAPAAAAPAAAVEPTPSAPSGASGAPPQPEAAGEQTARQGRKAARGRRSSVPSWDEIMFGNSRQRD